MKTSKYKDFAARILPEIERVVAILDWMATFRALMTGDYLA